MSQNTNINLIDPHDSITKLPSYMNGTPEYEKMFMFVELTAKRKKRTVLTTSGTGTGRSTRKEDNGFDKDINISMVGYDQETNDTKHTTRYSNNTAISGNKYEGFGMEGIKITTNSSFIPKVTIDFIDIRGMSFAQNKESVYNLLFDFPPPIYKLTVKGYYGKALTYELHLVKYNIKFVSKTGDYHITAEFVARTFAPLTDVLFKYVEMYPLMANNTIEPPIPSYKDQRIDDSDNPSTSSPSTLVKPTNTHDLLIKLENLYDDIASAKNSSEEAEAFDKAKILKNNVKSFNTRLINFENEYNVDDSIKKKGGFYVKNDSNIDSEPNMRSISLYEYNTILSATGSQTKSDNIDEKLIIAFPTGEIDPFGNFLENPNTLTIVKRELRKLRKNILNDASDIDLDKFRSTEDNEYITPTINNNSPTYSFDDGINVGSSNNSNYGLTIIDEQTNIEYRYINITLLYTEIHRIWSQSVDDLNNKQQNLVGKINDVILNDLGMKPTIYNYFKIICDDVDRFFQELKETSVEAENHHKNHNIVKDNNTNSSVGIKDKTVTAFPLFISAQTVCNVRRETRRMPTAENVGASIPEFPEALLVRRFMESFITVEKENRIRKLKEQKDALGNSVWIPVTPADSVLYDPYDSESPYYSLFESDNSLNNIYEKFLNRFYVQSQYTFGLDFFGEDTTQTILKNKNNLIEFLAKSEAVNISQSLAEDKLIDKLLQQANDYKQSGFDWFIKFLEDNNIINYTTVNSDALTITNGTNLYKNRGDSNYVGIKIFTKDNDRKKIARRSGQNESTDSSKNPVDNFINSNKQSEGWNFFNSVFGINHDKKRVSDFVIENIIYFPDTDSTNDYKSRFIMRRTDPKWNAPNKAGKYRRDFLNTLHDTSLNTNTTINQCATITEDNIINDPDRDGIFTTSNKKELFNYKNGNLFIKEWSEVLGVCGTEILDYLTSSTTSSGRTIQAVILASNFLRSTGHFNNNLSVNDNMKLPAVLEMPYYSPVYMGGLVAISEDDGLKELLIDFLRSDLGVRLRQVSVTGILGAEEIFNIKKGLRIPFDITLNSDPYVGDESPTYILYDLKKIDLLSENDKKAYKAVFDGFKDGGEAEDIKNDIVEMIKQVKDGDYDKRSEEMLQYKSLLGDGGENNNISEILNEKIYILNLTQFTFNNNANDTSTYQSLSELKDDATKINQLELYFKTFFSKLKETLNKNNEDLKSLEDRFRSNIDDNDIKTQTYYSFKNLNDKWVAGEDNSVYGFPFNRNNNDRLIDKFAFVDRAMNPIGDEVVINAEPLLEMANDYDISVFTVFSRLLAANGFEFFPLQNFMSYQNGEWEESFRIKETVQDQLATPSFVCMYVGGTSSFLNNKSSDYEDDGLDFNNMTDVSDFISNPCENQKEVYTKQPIDVQGKTNYPYSQVNAFRVRYAEQNQSIFKNISIDSREYTDTNESLAILAKIAQDESPSSPVPKAQNLYNTYETRAYTTKIDMFGNMMIQPTQYFQLENVPIFSGAYIILSVEHDIVPNHITTSFSGVKVLKFPNPFVKEYAVVYGINSGTSEDLSGGSSDGPSRKSVYGDAGAASLPPSAHYNSMYNLMLKPQLLNGE